MINFLKGIVQSVSLFSSASKVADSAKGMEAGRSVTKAPQGKAEVEAKKLDQAKQKQPIRSDKEVKQTKLELHPQTQSTKNSDKKTESRAKTFFKRLFSGFKSDVKNAPNKDEDTIEKHNALQAANSATSPPEDSPTAHFKDLVKQNKMDEAGAYLTQIDQGTALKLIKDGKANVGKALTRQLNNPENKEAAQGLIKKTLEAEIAATTDSATLFRSSTAGAGIIGELQSQYIPEESKQNIRGIALITSKDTEYAILPKGNEVNTVISSENQTQILKQMEEGLKMLLKATENPPSEIQSLNQIIYDSVTKKFGEEAAKQQIVGGNFLLRFANPLVVTNPDVKDIQKKNTMILAKGLQNLANGAEFKKEQHMLFFNEFLRAPSTAAIKEQMLNNLLGR